MANYVFTNELYHHGILGQKWGVRRYQNSDGSYTEAGKKRLMKLDYYKNSEHRKLDKKYNLAKMDYKIAKLNDKYQKSNSKRNLRKLQEATAKKYAAEGMRAIEEQAINKMTVDQMNAERIAVAKNAVSNVLRASSTAGIAVAGVTGAHVIGDTIRIADKANRDIRLMNSPESSIYKEAIQKVFADHGFAGKVGNFMMTKYSVNYNRYKEAFELTDKYFDKLKNTQAASLGIGIVGAGIKLRTDIARGKYKSSDTVKTNLRVSSADQYRLKDEALKRTMSELHR